MEIVGKNVIVDGKKAVLKVKQGDKWIEFAPVINAKWKLLNEGRATCTNCNFTQACVWDYDSYQRYCGVCGAKMELGINYELYARTGK